MDYRNKEGITRLERNIGGGNERLEGRSKSSLREGGRGRIEAREAVRNGMGV